MAKDTQEIISKIDDLREDMDSSFKSLNHSIVDVMGEQIKVHQKKLEEHGKRLGEHEKRMFNGDLRFWILATAFTTFAIWILTL